MSRFPRTNGFTLAEIMVVIILLGVMAGLALPRLTAAINRGKNGEAEGMLLAIFSAQKDYYRENGVYTTNEADLDITIPTLKNFNNLDIIGTSDGTDTCNAATVQYLGELQATASPHYWLRVDDQGKIYCTDGTCFGGTCRKMGYSQ